MTSTRNDKAIKIDKLKNPDIANPSFRKFYIHDKCIIWSFIRKDVIPNFENTNNLTILCNLHFTIIFNTTYSKPSISSNLRTLQIRSSHARLSGSYNTKHCQDNTICLLAKKKKLIVWRHQCLRFPSREPNFGMHLLSWMSQWWYLI